MVDKLDVAGSRPCADICYARSSSDASPRPKNSRILPRRRSCPWVPLPTPTISHSASEKRIKLKDLLFRLTTFKPTVGDGTHTGV